ncbi:hypothetical protein EDD17DRAFT_1507185 [Pisolithus thermaeus]|nr:hypothetical protein EDD17DRAFT_1507185 [Pisolithus thermaeus]
MSLAICLGLHMRSGDAPVTGSVDFLVNSLPRLPRGGAIEEQGRLDAWWTIRSFVKFVETIYVGPPVVSSMVNITAPWPLATRDCSVAPNGAKRDKVSQFLLAPNVGIKGETLFGLQASPDTGGTYSSRQMLLIVNLTTLAQITLHRSFVLPYASFSRRCVESAIRAVQALNGLEDPRIMNPICMYLKVNKSNRVAKSILKV